MAFIGPGVMAQQVEPPLAKLTSHVRNLIQAPLLYLQPSFLLSTGGVSTG